MVARMKYETVNQRDARDRGRDEKRLRGSIREIRAIRGSLPELDHGWHGVHGFPAAWHRWIWVRPSRTQSNPIAPSKPEYATETNEEHKVEFSCPDLESRQITFVVFATFCSNLYGLADCCADFTHLRAHQRRSVKSVAPNRTESHPVKVSRTQSNHEPKITDSLALLCGFLGKGRTSFCKSLISMIVSDSSRISSFESIEKCR